jgi:hypothetical protein
MIRYQQVLGQVRAPAPEFQNKSSVSHDHVLQLGRRWQRIDSSRTVLTSRSFVYFSGTNRNQAAFVSAAAHNAVERQR